MLSNLSIADETTIKGQGLVLPEFFISSDSEKLSIKKASLGYLPFYEHGDSNTGIKLQNNQFHQDSWSIYSNQISFITKEINSKTTLGYLVNLGVNQLEGKSIITIDSQYQFKLFDKTSIELILNRDRVETQKALENNTFFTMAAINIEQEIRSDLRAMLMIGEMKFSDGNSRPFLRARLIADVLPDYGVNLQLRYRQFHSDDIDVERNYFNPEDYRETMLVIGYRKRFEGWNLAGTLGVGRQEIDNLNSTQTKLIEFNATSPFVKNIFFRTRLGYSQAAGFQGADYSYRYLFEELIFAF